MMKRILGTGLMSMLLLSGAAFAQTPGNFIEGAKNAGGAAARESNEILDPLSPAELPPAPENTPVPAVETPVAEAPVAVVETPAEPEVPGANAPVLLSPESMAGAGITQGRIETGLIGKTSQVGEDIMLLQQNKAFLDQIKLTVDMIGIENTLAMYPQYADFLDTSPLALTSQLSRVQTLNELREEVARASGPTQYELDMAEQNAAAPAQVATLDDGTGLMSMEINDGTQEVMTRDDVAMLIEEARLRDEQSADAYVEEEPVRATPVYGMTVEEVYGANGQMVAVLSDGMSTYKVRVSDEIPDVGQITMITKDAVTVSMNGEEQQIRFR